MSVEIAAPLHFAAEFLVLAVCVGAAFEALRGRDGPQGKLALIQAAGFSLLALAQALHGARIFESDAARGLAVLRTASFGLLAVGARSSGAAAPAVFLAGKAPLWSAAPAVLAGLVAMRGAAAHRKDQDPATFAFAASFATFAAAEVSTAVAGEAGGNWLTTAHALRAVAAFLLARWLWTSIVRSIRLRFVAAFIAALLVLVLVISASITQVIGNNIKIEELSRVSTTATSEAQGLKPLVQRAVTGAATLASSSLIRTFVSPANGPALAAVIQGRALRNLFPDVDFIVVVDRRGRRLASAAGVPGEDRSVVRAMPAVQAEAVVGSDLVATTLQRRAVGETIDAAGLQTIVAMAAAPVLTDKGVLVGALALGYRLDQSYLASVGGRYPDAVVSMLHGGEVVATTGEAAAVTRALVRGRTGVAVRRNAVEGGREYRSETAIDGKPYFTAFVPLKRTIDGQTVAVLAMSSPATSATQRGINQILFIVTLAAAAIAALIAWLVGGRITRPIRRLTDAAERVRRGDLEARADVEAGDEVGALGSAFNEMTGSLVSLTDDLREAAEEEASLRGQMEAIMQSMGDGLIATDASGRVVAFNRAAEQIVGREARRALGKQLADLLRTDNGNGPDVVELALGGGGEAVLIREGGGRVPVALTSAPLRDPSGKPGGRVIVFRDVSREAEAERMKTEFLSNVSHELRTPLTPIKGYTEILKRKQFPRQKALGFLEGILESTSRLERIVEILVDFAAMEAGRLKARKEPVDVRTFASGVLTKWKQRDSAHAFSLQVPANLPRIEADPRLLSKCIDELIDNAVKFSPARNGSRKPKVVVEAGLARGGPTRLLRLSVHDYGIGISPEQMPSIFQDFRQLDGSETRPYGGLGLGLAYAKRVVEVHQGSIEVESTPGKGSTFSLLLPLADARRGGSARRAPGRPTRKATRR